MEKDKVTNEETGEKDTSIKKKKKKKKSQDK